MSVNGVESLSESDEIARDQARTLVDQLIEGMLTIGSRLAPVDRSGVVIDRGTVKRHVLAVALHSKLLEVGGEPLQILLVRKDSDRLGTKEVVVPNCKQAHENREVAIEGRCTKMFVHLMEAIQHSAK